MLFNPRYCCSPPGDLAVDLKPVETVPSWAGGQTQHWTVSAAQQRPLPTLHAHVLYLYLEESTSGRNYSFITQ